MMKLAIAVACYASLLVACGSDDRSAAQDSGDDAAHDLPNPVTPINPISRERVTQKAFQWVRIDWRGSGGQYPAIFRSRIG